MKTPAATPSLQDILHQRIAGGGSLGFSEFMSAALYDPDHGYYARDIRQVGRAGDFFTSVSVGPLFGHLLARRFLSHWRGIGCPPRWRVIECGAHDGTLAADVLAALSELDPAAFAAMEYVISEPLPGLRIRQAARLKDFADRVRLLAAPDLLSEDPLPGMAFGNEVLDALPCHLVVRRGARWMERRVGWGGAGLEWVEREIRDPWLSAALQPLGGGFPEGYRTEVRTCYRDFLAPLSRALDHGMMLWIDYGFERADYYLPSRIDGTLRTYCAHRAGDDPLEMPGAADITAHVDFTAVEAAASALGGRRVLLRSQGAWLTEIARDWLLGMEGRPQPDPLRQFQTLTHPAQLGGRFQVIELSC